MAHRYARDLWISAREFWPAWIGWTIAVALFALGKFGEARDAVEILVGEPRMPPPESFYLMALASGVIGSFLAFHRVRMQRDLLKDQHRDQFFEIKELIDDGNKLARRIRLSDGPAKYASEVDGFLDRIRSSSLERRAVEYIVRVASEVGEEQPADHFWLAERISSVTQRLEDIQWSVEDPTL